MDTVPLLPWIPCCSVGKSRRQGIAVALDNVFHRGQEPVHGTTVAWGAVLHWWHPTLPPHRTVCWLWSCRAWWNAGGPWMWRCGSRAGQGVDVKLINSDDFLDDLPRELLAETRRT